MELRRRHSRQPTPPLHDPRCWQRDTRRYGLRSFPPLHHVRRRPPRPQVPAGTNPRRSTRHAPRCSLTTQERRTGRIGARRPRRTGSSPRREAARRGGTAAAAAETCVLERVHGADSASVGEGIVSPPRAGPRDRGDDAVVQSRAGTSCRSSARAARGAWPDRRRRLVAGHLGRYAALHLGGHARVA